MNVGYAPRPFPAVMGSHDLSFFSLETMHPAPKTRYEYIKNYTPSPCGEARNTMLSHVSSFSLPPEGTKTHMHGVTIFGHSRLTTVMSLGSVSDMP